MDRIAEYLKSYTEKYPSGHFKENEPMRDHTSFKIGGNAPVMFFPEIEEEIVFREKSPSWLVAVFCWNAIKNGRDAWTRTRDTACIRRML